MSHSNGRSVLGAWQAVQELRNRGAQFWIESGTLRYRAPKGVSVDALVALLRANMTSNSLPFEGGAKLFEPRVLKRADPIRAPLGFSQLGHWNLRAAENYHPVRQVASATCLRGKLDVEALREAFLVVVGRHEALRTRLVVRNGEPIQEIVDRPCDLKVIELTLVRPCDRALEVQRQITSAIVDVADYGMDPLFAAALLRLGSDENVLILAVDHVIGDGASLGIVRSELWTAYTQLVTASHISLPAVQMQLADYAVWQRTELAGWLKNRASEWSSWPRTRFPEDPRGDMTGWGAVRFVIHARKKRDLQDWARRHGTSLVMTVLTAYVALVLRWCRTSEAVVQFVSDGRLSPLLEHTVGDIAFPLFMRIPCDGSATFRDLLERITAEYCRACEEPDFGYSYAQESVPEFVRNTSFNWLPLRESSADPMCLEGAAALNGSDVAFEHPALETLEWDVEPTMAFRETGSDIIGEVYFQRRRFSYPIMTRFIENFRIFLDTLLSTPQMRIRQVVLT